MSKYGPTSVRTFVVRQCMLKHVVYDLRMKKVSNMYNTIARQVCFCSYIESNEAWHSVNVLVIAGHSMFKLVDSELKEENNGQNGN